LRVERSCFVGRRRPAGMVVRRFELTKAIPSKMPASS
jgi:hypothetical protein